MTLDSRAQDVLDFWFGELDDSGLADETHGKKWWTKSAEFDAEIRDRFGDLYGAVTSDECESWLETPRGRLAYVIVIDQFSRNMFRDQAQMYAADERAVRVVLGGLDAGHDDALGPHERTFLYMPLMHSESIEEQDKCVALFQALIDAWEDPVKKLAQNHHGYAVQHRDIVKKFGRFPHRNKILGRETTEEERSFLEQPGSSF